MYMKSSNSSTSMIQSLDIDESRFIACFPSIGSISGLAVVFGFVNGGREVLEREVVGS